MVEVEWEVLAYCPEKQSKMLIASAGQITEVRHKQGCSLYFLHQWKCFCFIFAGNHFYTKRNGTWLCI